MAFDIYQGDPAMVLTPDGADLFFIEGQPVMDQGLENASYISLLTEEGWCGNAIAPLDEAIGSGFVAETRKPITRTQLDRIAKAAKAAMKDMAFSEAQVEISNPSSAQIRAMVRVAPPTQDIGALLIQSVGNNWLAQAVNPAHRRLATA